MALLATFVVVGGVWASQITGLSSSNDGSHAALSRAIWMRGQTTIEPDVALTLGVDRARKGERWYSDRPPGTAFVAGPVVAAGASLDGWAFDASVRKKALVAQPGSAPYILTYAARSPRAPALAKRIGTGLGASVAAWMLGLLAMALTAAAGWRARGLDLQREGRAMVAATLALGLGSLFGPYSTMLFAHVTAALGVAGLLWALADNDVDSSTTLGRRRLVVGGLFASVAVSADYATVVLIVGLVVVLRWGRWRELAWIAVGALPIACSTAGYHWAAFGGPFRIGYDYQTNFEFAQDRSRTFSGNPIAGLWHLLGWGDSGGGLLALCPVWLLGAWGLGRSRRGTALLGVCALYVLMLSTHQTPWGGAGRDHRYLIAVYPLLAVGLIRFLASPLSRPGVVWAATGVAFVLSLRAWTHTAGWRETPVVVSWWIVAGAGLTAAAACGLVALRRRRLLGDRPSC